MKDDLIRRAKAYLSVLNADARRREGAKLIAELAERVESPLVWTDAKPTVPGWYWWRDSHWVEPIHVIELDGRIGVPSLEVGDLDPLPDDQFAGPIPHPADSREGDAAP